jgi:hypothetical protein
VRPLTMSITISVPRRARRPRSPSALKSLDFRVCGLRARRAHVTPKFGCYVIMRDGVMAALRRAWREDVKTGVTV